VLYDDSAYFRRARIIRSIPVSELAFAPIDSHFESLNNFSSMLGNMLGSSSPLSVDEKRSLLNVAGTVFETLVPVLEATTEDGDDHTWVLDVFWRGIVRRMAEDSGRDLDVEDAVCGILESSLQPAVPAWRGWAARVALDEMEAPRARELLLQYPEPAA
jgi:hypothetical protein